MMITMGHDDDDGVFLASFGDSSARSATDPHRPAPSKHSRHALDSYVLKLRASARVDSELRLEQVCVDGRLGPDTCFSSPSRSDHV